jgi:hypothetical protein
MLFHLGEWRKVFSYIGSTRVYPIMCLLHDNIKDPWVLDCRRYHPS